MESWYDKEEEGRYLHCLQINSGRTKASIIIQRNHYLTVAQLRLVMQIFNKETLDEERNIARNLVLIYNEYADMLLAGKTLNEIYKIYEQRRKETPGQVVKENPYLKAKTGRDAQ